MTRRTNGTRGGQSPSPSGACSVVRSTGYYDVKRRQLASLLFYLFIWTLNRKNKNEKKGENYRYILLYKKITPLLPYQKVKGANWFDKESI